MSKRYVSEGLQAKAREVLAKEPRTIAQLARALKCSPLQARFCREQVGAVFKGRTKRGKGAGRPFDLWGMP